MIGKGTHIVDCRVAMGMGEGGGIAQRGTFAQSGSEVLTIAMSPGRRHITKPVCEITFALREANIMTSTLVLNAGAGVPHAMFLNRKIENFAGVKIYDFDSFSCPKIQRILKDFCSPRT